MLRLNLMFCILYVLCIGCNPSAKHQTKIEELSSRWEKLADRTIQLSLEMSDNVEDWQGMYHGMYSGVKIEDMSDDRVGTINELKMTCLGHGDVYVEIQEILDMKVKMMEVKGVEVQNLILGLEAKDLPEDVQTQLDSLNSYLETEEKVIREFEEMTESTKKQCLKTCAEFAQLLEVSE